MTRYRQASGPSFRSCAVLGYPNDSESVVVLIREAAAGAPVPLDLGVRCGVSSLMTGLWRSPTGAVYTVDRQGIVRWSAEPWGGPWNQQPLDARFRGITGRDDQLVWAFGERSDGASLVRMFDGTAWKPISSPGFTVQASTVGEHSWFVGDEGGVARYDVDRWSVVSMGDLRLVAAHEAEGVLWVAAEDGQVFRGDLSGFEWLGAAPFRPHAIARWGGATWLGGGSEGLFRLGDDGVLDLVRADRACRSLDARGELLIGCDDVVSGSPDGQRFPATGRGFLER